MADREKVAWACVFLVLWGACLSMFIVISLMPGPHAHTGAVSVAGGTIASSAVVCLVWSWRWFYTAGRKHATAEGAR